MTPGAKPNAVQLMEVALVTFGTGTVGGGGGNTGYWYNKDCSAAAKNEMGLKQTPVQPAGLTLRMPEVVLYVAVRLVPLTSTERYSNCILPMIDTVIDDSNEVLTLEMDAFGQGKIVSLKLPYNKEMLGFGKFALSRRAGA